MGSEPGCVLLWAANPGAQRILVVGRWLVPGRELNPDLEVHNGTRYPTELSAHLAQLVWRLLNAVRYDPETLESNSGAVRGACVSFGYRNKSESESCMWPSPPVPPDGLRVNVPKSEYACMLQLTCIHVL